MSINKTNETVIITGGTGLIGSRLCQLLHEKGYRTIVLSRNTPSGISTSANDKSLVSFWNPEKGIIDESLINQADYIIHLAGANIGESRWTLKRKQLIQNSRTEPAKFILETIKKRRNKIKAFITASAIGYYGSVTSNKIFTETDQPAQDFLGETCNKWEAAADEFETLGIRTVKIRTGMVLSKEQGALSKMKLPAKFGISASFGNGKQYLPWIHIDDLCLIYIQAIQNSNMKGPFNAVAPQHVTNKEFNGSIIRFYKKTFIKTSIPAFLLRIILGEMSDILLKGSRISSDKICLTGYKFRYPELHSALKNLLGGKTI